MKSKLLLLIFVLAGVLWALAVIIAATNNRFTTSFLSVPWAGIALGTFGGFMIGALGLRMYAISAHKEDMRKLRLPPPQVSVHHWNEMQAPFEQEHREPYICHRSVIR
jgi:hypothetical protein